VVRGVAERVFGYMSGEVPKLGTENRFLVAREKVRFGTKIADDEVEFETGFLLAPSALPVAPGEPASTPATGGASVPGPTEVSGGVGPAPVGGKEGVSRGLKREVVLQFQATRGQLFKAFGALANLADRSQGGKVTVRIQATAAADTGFDPGWLRNAVEEPLDEADIEREQGAG
jgi:hypothetical protein